MIHPERRGQAPRARSIEEMLARIFLRTLFVDLSGFEWI